MTTAWLRFLDRLERFDHWLDMRAPWIHNGSWFRVCQWVHAEQSVWEKGKTVKEKLLSDLLLLAHDIGRWDELGLLELLPDWIGSALRNDLDLAERLRKQIAEDPALRAMLDQALAE